MDAIGCEGHYEELDGEQHLKRRYRQATVGGIIIAAIIFCVGLGMVTSRGKSESGVCCLPAGCDISRLSSRGVTRGRNPYMCNFTQAEIDIMGCTNIFRQISSCQIAHGDHQCTSNKVNGFMVGAGVPLIVAGLLICIMCLSFVLPGYDCFGSDLHKKTCCNVCARISFFFFWCLVVSACIVGIVFGAMLIHSLYEANFSSHEAHCDGGHHHHNKYDTQEAHCNRATWVGDSCPLDGQPANIFTWIKPTHAVKFNALLCLAISVGFVLFTVGMMIYSVVLCCKSCNRRQQYNAEHRDRAYAPRPHYSPSAEPVTGVVAPPIQPTCATAEENTYPSKTV